MEIINKIKEIIAGLEEDVTKFYEKGNKAAGTRIRKESQEIKKLVQELRVDVQNNKKK